MEIKLDKETAIEIARELHRLQKEEASQSEYVLLKDLTAEFKCSFYTLNERRKAKHIPKVEGVREVAILKKYKQELKTAS